MAVRATLVAWVGLVRRAGSLDDNATAGSDRPDARGRAGRPAYKLGMGLVLNASISALNGGMRVAEVREARPGTATGVRKKRHNRATPAMLRN